MGDGNEMRFLVRKSSGDVEVLLLPYKGTNKFSFVNLTKGHICSCVFASAKEAIQDMEYRKASGLLIDYEEI